MCYTDGSRHLHEEEEVTGAGCYAPAAPAQEQATTINPCGKGVGNTVLRAELTGILTGLRKRWQTIATDSATSLWLIRRAILNPMTLQTHLHRWLLENIVTALDDLTRAGKTVHLLKVKAHSGVIGNECADVTAKKAAREADACNVNIAFPEDPFADRVWVQRKPNDEGGPRDWLFPNAGAALKQHILQTSRMGTANTESIYFKLWQKVAGEAVPGSLAKAMNSSSITAEQRKLALQYRNGNLYNQKHAFWWGHAPNPNCLCCGNPDSATHVLQGPCTQAHSGMVSNRHHEAVGLIAKAVLKGGRGGDLRFADISDNVAERIGLDTREWKDGWKDLQSHLTGNRDAHCSRPDLVLIQVAGKTDEPTKATLVEVKYCADTNFEERYKQACEQHDTLNRMVREFLENRPVLGRKRSRTGQMQAEVETVVLLIGVTGTPYTKYTLDPLVQKLGLEPSRANKLIDKLIGHSLKHAVMLNHYRHCPSNQQPS
jgi:ribonuclease HI